MEFSLVFQLGFKLSITYIQLLVYPKCHRKGISPFHPNHGAFWLNTMWKQQPVVCNGPAEFSWDLLFHALMQGFSFKYTGFKVLFYMISWHVEEWSTSVWGKRFTDTPLSGGLIYHASLSQALFPSFHSFFGGSMLHSTGRERASLCTAAIYFSQLLSN